MRRRSQVFAELIKYRLSLAVTLSSVTGYFLYGKILDIHLLSLIAGVFLLASGSAVLNQYSERHTDRLMERTRNRPVPSGRTDASTALRLSFILISAGAACLFMNGIIPLFSGLLNVVLYNVLYTRLKRITVLSIIPGGLVGAVPPMIGYSSAGGSLLDMNIIAFSAFMFLWQLPHFWLLIIKYGNEYRNAGLATISSYLNDIQIRWLVFIWVLVSTVLMSLYLTVSDLPDNPVLLSLPVLNIVFIILFYQKLFLTRDKAEIKGAFVLINSLSILIMVFIITRSIVQYIRIT